MRTLREMSPFRRDLKRVQASGRNCIADVKHAVSLLQNDSPLPEHLRDHALSGGWTKLAARECHVKPDLLLVYCKPDNELHLLRLTSHSVLFRK